MNRIRELRLLRGITVEELSRATCVPLGIIVRLDKGEDVTASEPIWNGLSNFFGVPVDYLMGFTNGWEDEHQREIFIARRGAEKWCSEEELRGYSHDDLCEGVPVPSWLYDNMKYFAPYFGSEENVLGCMEFARFFRGCKTLADVARVMIDRHEMSVGFSVNTTSTEYGDGLCECMLSRPHTHYLITPNGVVEYYFVWD